VNGAATSLLRLAREGNECSRRCGGKSAGFANWRASFAVRVKCRGMIRRRKRIQGHALIGGYTPCGRRMCSATRFTLVGERHCRARGYGRGRPGPDRLNQRLVAAAGSWERRPSRTRESVLPLLAQPFAQLSCAEEVSDSMRRGKAGFNCLGLARDDSPAIKPLHQEDSRNLWPVTAGRRDPVLIVSRCLYARGSGIRRGEMIRGARSYRG